MSDFQHNLPALVDQSSYRNLITLPEIDESTLFQAVPTPRLHLPASVRLPCLHGRLRLENAKTDDEWWLVDLYDSSLPAEIVTQIRREYRDHSPLCDGEKYLRIRYYQRRGLEADENQWRRLLSPSKLKNLDQLLRNDWLCRALDKLEPFRSLWMNFQLGSIPPILSWRCSQEVEHYLERMWSIWHRLVDGNGSLCDEHTVRCLQGLAPRWNYHDRSMIQSFFNDKKVFHRARPEIRAQILQRILAVDGIILSFQTFFKDVKVLEPVMLRLRDLFSLDELYPKKACFCTRRQRPASIREVLISKCYSSNRTGANRVLLQYSEFEYHHAESRTPAIHAYLQLCFYVIRHQQYISGSISSKFPKSQAKQKQPLDHPAWRIKLGKLAYKLGFNSDIITELCRQDEDLSHIKQHMLQERPVEFYTCMSDDFAEQAIARQGGQVIFQARQLSTVRSMTTSSIADLGMKDYSGLFLPTIWHAMSQEKSLALTTFGTLVLTLTAFFGSLESPVEKSSISEEMQEYSQPVQTQFLPEKESTERTCSSEYTSSVLTHSNAEKMPNITFWSLPEDFSSLPTPTHQCESTLNDINKVVQSLQSKGLAPSLTLVSNDGRLKLCPPSQILDRRKQSPQPNDVYYLSGNESSKEWVLKTLASANPWRD